MSISAPIKILLCLFGMLVAYLFFWPVPINPQAWNAPDAPGLINEYALNDRLKNIERLKVADNRGPEDIAFSTDGWLYAGYTNGNILRMRPDGSAASIAVNTGGRPLGLDFAPDGGLIIADAVKGLLRWQNNQLEVLAAEANGKRMLFVDDVDVAANGMIYFSDATQNFGIGYADLDVIEHNGTGRIFSYDPVSKKLSLLMDGLNFANGTALGPDDAYLLVTETGQYRVHRYWLEGERSGQSEVIADNLPGIPDNITHYENGEFWLALFAPRNAALDFSAPYPLLRKMIMRLPEFARIKPAHHAFALSISGDGELLANLQHPGPDSYSPVTAVRRHEGHLYFGSLSYPAVGRLAWTPESK